MEDAEEHDEGLLYRHLHCCPAVAAACVHRGDHQLHPYEKEVGVSKLGGISCLEDWSFAKHSDCVAPMALRQLSKHGTSKLDVCCESLDL